MRLIAVLALPLALSACLGGGRDLPDTLATLTSTAPEIEPGARSAAREDAVTVLLPLIPQALDTDRVPVKVGDTAIAYVTDLVWVDTPDVLFQQMLSESLSRLTGRVVLDPGQAMLNPGLRVTGSLSRFDYDSRSGEVVVRYDAAIARSDGTAVETRRFEARRPADGMASGTAAALNEAANQVAVDVATWIGG
ncbi:ABC-type transport auxiliary lipoprotein family protein [Sphingomicrobium nitratireducens]|uniref:ABC-type transport auxiliary lipoprotein family protein n=1 Tax=Sphingomicrobium nitratireducens TaxID=2964666 RepID=UPI00223EF695|nr:ABC-type transport auxiliary lipoprotein family protein [Sphingomicrobium nitratireducens]